MTSVPVPYFFGNDNVVLSFFLLNLLGIAYVFVLNGNGILQRLKNMFYYTSNSKPYNNQTHINRLCNCILYMQFVLFLSVLSFAKLQYDYGLLYIERSYLFFVVYAIFFLSFFGVKRMVYSIVNHVLFTSRQEKEWHDSYFFTIQLAGFLLFPLVSFVLFVPQLSYTIYFSYITITVLICLLMLIRCGKRIIFFQRYGFVEIILYLCTLEILPMAVLVKAIHELNEFLMIKF